MSNFKITKVTAFVAVDPETGDECTLVWRAPDGQYIALMSDRPSSLKGLLAFAEDIKARQGTKYRIIQFSVREDVTDQVRKQFMP